MTIQEICMHERLGMLTRHWCGYDKHDDHLWRWLNHELRLWSASRPFKVV